jgi:hypothetical protein
MANHTWREPLFTGGGIELEVEVGERAGFGLDIYMAIWKYVH